MCLQSRPQLRHAFDLGLSLHLHFRLLSLAFACLLRFLLSAPRGRRRRRWPVQLRVGPLHSATVVRVAMRAGRARAELEQHGVLRHLGLRRLEREAEALGVSRDGRSVLVVRVYGIPVRSFLRSIAMVLIGPVGSFK